MRDDEPPDQRQHGGVSPAGIAERRSAPDRRSTGDRRRSVDRRRGGERRETSNPDLLFADLEMRVATALRQHGGLLEGDGSGWDKLIVPFR